MESARLPDRPANLRPSAAIGPATADAALLRIAELLRQHSILPESHIMNLAEQVFLEGIRCALAWLEPEPDVATNNRRGKRGRKLANQ